MLCSLARLDGYRSAMTMAGLAVDPRLVRFGDFRVRSGFEHAMDPLGDPTGRRPSSRDSDLQALGVLEAARLWGLSVPEDLSVVGYDDVPLAQWSGPLTTVHQPMRHMAEAATRMLFRPDDPPRSRPAHGTGDVSSYGRARRDGGSAGSRRRRSARTREGTCRSRAVRAVPACGRRRRYGRATRATDAARAAGAALATQCDLWRPVRPVPPTPPVRPMRPVPPVRPEAARRPVRPRRRRHRDNVPPAPTAGGEPQTSATARRAALEHGRRGERSGTVLVVRQLREGPDAVVPDVRERLCRWSTCG